MCIHVFSEAQEQTSSHFRCSVPQQNFVSSNALTNGRTETVQTKLQCDCLHVYTWSFCFQLVHILRHHSGGGLYPTLANKASKGIPRFFLLGQHAPALRSCALVKNKRVFSCLSSKPTPTMTHLRCSMPQQHQLQPKKRLKRFVRDGARWTDVSSVLTHFALDVRCHAEEERDVEAQLYHVVPVLGLQQRLDRGKRRMGCE